MSVACLRHTGKKELSTVKAYLQSFLKEFFFDVEDAERLTAAFARLCAHKDAWERFSRATALYREEPVCDHARLIGLADEAAGLCGIHEYTAELLLYMVLSETLRERYRERGIDDALFYDTMCDLRYKLEECKAVKGIVGTFVASWFAGFFELTRFAVGRLQFEVVPFDATYEKDGKRLSPDSRVINVHIPRDGTPLDAARCEEAYRRAAAFFCPQITGDIAFVCYSWLLYPELKTILPENSNIVRFASRYELVRWGISKDNPDLWRLFDTDERHPDRLPQDTTARRCVAAHLKAGGKLGWGYGVFFMD